MKRIILVCGAATFFRSKKKGGFTQNPKEADFTTTASGAALLIQRANADYDESWHLAVLNDDGTWKSG